MHMDSFDICYHFWHQFDIIWAFMKVQLTRQNEDHQAVEAQHQLHVFFDRWYESCESATGPGHFEGGDWRAAGEVWTQIVGADIQWQPWPPWNDDGMGHQHRISCIHIRVGSWQNFSQGNRELLLEACHDRELQQEKMVCEDTVHWFTGLYSLVCVCEFYRWVEYIEFLRHTPVLLGYSHAFSQKYSHQLSQHRSFKNNLRAQGSPWRWECSEQRWIIIDKYMRYGLWVFFDSQYIKTPTGNLRTFELRTNTEIHRGWDFQLLDKSHPLFEDGAFDFLGI